jgi:hypothetical protein
MMAIRVSLWLLLRILANVIYNKSKISITFLYKFRVSAPKFILPSGKATSLILGLQEINEILISVCKARQCANFFLGFVLRVKGGKAGNSTVSVRQVNMTRSHTIEEIHYRELKVSTRSQLDKS